MENAKETLLIVDDSKFQRAVLRQMLRDSFDLIEVESGEECIEIMNDEKQKVNMVLLDLVMPGIDGFEVLRRRQKMERFKNIPVIVLTTSDSDSFQNEAFELGADEFIIKPVDSRIALTRINNILDARRRLRTLIKKQEELKLLSEIDGMTKLFNKTMTERLVTKTLENQDGQKHAFMVIDIDNFKAVNDIFGHKVGDHVITVVAGVISSVFSKNDYVGRIGGDEFVVMMRDIASEDVARQSADRLIEKIRIKENLTIPDNISLSVGLAFTDGTQKTYADIFSKADEGLYIAKKSGKNGWAECDGTHQESSGNDSHAERSVREVLVLGKSRNVNSILEFIFQGSVTLNAVSTLEDIKKAFLSKDGQIIAIYIDMSGVNEIIQEESQKSGTTAFKQTYQLTEKLWLFLKEAEWLQGCPVTAICQEGDMTQIRYAINSGIADDIIFAPLNAENVTRRAKAFNLI